MSFVVDLICWMIWCQLRIPWWIFHNFHSFVTEIEKKNQPKKQKLRLRLKAVSGGKFGKKAFDSLYYNFHQFNVVFLSRYLRFLLVFLLFTVKRYGHPSSPALINWARGRHICRLTHLPQHTHTHCEVFKCDCILTQLIKSLSTHLIR